MTKENTSLHSYPTIFAAVALFITLLAITSTIFLFVGDTHATSETVASISPVDDAYGMSGQADTNFGARDNLWIGYFPAGNAGDMAIALKFDIEQLPKGSKVTKAELLMYMFQPKTAEGDTATLRLRRILNNDAWDEGNLTWQLYNNLLQFGTSYSLNVSLTVGANRLDVTQILDEAIRESAPTIGIAIEFPLHGATTDSYATFWSKEYGETTKRPLLIVDYSAPTPTPTVTPGTKAVSLMNLPTDALKGGDVTTYTINIYNGPYPLSNIVVTNTAPNELVVLTDTVDSGMLDWRPQIQGQQITWTLNQTLPPDAADQLSYQAARPTPAPTAIPTALAIAKSGPHFVVSGGLITYTLRVDNQTPYTLTDVTITDTIPVNLEIIDAGGGVVTSIDESEIEWQELSSLASGEALTKTFSGRAAVDALEIVNTDYRVHATISHSAVVESIVATGAVSVATYVTTTLPLEPEPVIINAGACIQWEYAVPGRPNQSGVQCSGHVFNPSKNRWLPYIGR